jgi:hypothetical protein
MSVHENITEKSMFSSPYPRIVFVGNHCCSRACEKLTADFRVVSDPSLYSPRFSRNQYTPCFPEKRIKVMEKKPSREYLSDEFGKDSFNVGILIMYS